MPAPDCRVVLIRPHYAGNLGATARVMHNFGLSRLVLVSPIADHHDREARRLSTHGEFILDQAELVGTLEEAVADCALVAATSANTAGLFRGAAGSIRDLMPQLATSAGPVALVFGPEPDGLTNAEISICHYLLHIPTAPEYPALNLAQAVAVCLYEWRLARLPAFETSAEPAPFAQQQRMFEHLRAGLEAIHFLYGPKADTLMHALRQLIARAQPSEPELKLLHGLARQLEWIARHPGAAGDRADPPPLAGEQT
jgi:tRNA/rRNA methyltransferase